MKKFLILLILATNVFNCLGAGKKVSSDLKVSLGDSVFQRGSFRYAQPHVKHPDESLCASGRCEYCNYAAVSKKAFDHACDCVEGLVPFCSHCCNSSGGLLVCTGSCKSDSKKTYYCNRECQKLDRKDHIRVTKCKKT